MFRKSENYIVTNSGNKFYATNPTKDSIFLDDIAHSLSRIIRFNGHCEKLYSVAEHCIRGIELMIKLGYSKDCQRAFALHDASEIYLGDMVSPFKKLLSDYEELESIVQTAIYNKYLGNDGSSFKKDVKYIDITMLINEINQLTNHPEKYDVFNGEYHFVDISNVMTPDQTKRRMLEIFEELGIHD